MCIGLHVKYLLFLSDCNETRIFLTDFRKMNTKFHENPFRWSKAVPCGWTDRQKWRS